MKIKCLVLTIEPYLPASGSQIRTHSLADSKHPEHLGYYKIKTRIIDRENFDLIY